MKRHLFPLLLTALLLAPSSPTRAEDKPAPHKIQLYYNPLGKKFPLDPPPDGAPGAGPAYPFIPNRLESCLPGKMRDVKAFFEETGVKFTEAGDFAWFNPESNLVIIRCEEKDAGFLQNLFDAVLNDPPFNTVITASVSAGADASGKNPKADLLRSSLATKSGQRSVITAAGKNGSNYSLEIEPVIAASGDIADMNLAFKTTCLGRDYAVTTSLALAAGKPETLILGTTAHGKDIYFHLAFHMEPVYSGTPAKDRSKDPALLKQIEKALAASK